MDLVAAAAAMGISRDEVASGAWVVRPLDDPAHDVSLLGEVVEAYAASPVHTRSRPRGAVALGGAWHDLGDPGGAAVTLARAREAGLAGEAPYLLSRYLAVDAAGDRPQTVVPTAAALAAEAGGVPAGAAPFLAPGGDDGTLRFLTSSLERPDREGSWHVRLLGWTVSPGGAVDVAVVAERVTAVRYG